MGLFGRSKSSSTSKTPQNGKGIFGAPFSGIPPFLPAALTYLEENNCLTLDGFFRTNGDMNTVLAMRMWIESHEGAIDFGQFFMTNCRSKGPALYAHDVSSLVKSYFRDLTEPAFPFIIYNALVSAGGLLYFAHFVCCAICSPPC